MTRTIDCRTDDCISLMVTGTLRMTSTVDCRADDCISLLVTGTLRMTSTINCRTDNCISLMVTGTLRMTIDDKLCNNDDGTRFDALNKFVKSKLQTGSEKFIIPEMSILDVNMYLKKLDKSKATGLDDVGPNILSMCSDVIAPALTYIFNLSIKSGKFPSIFKTARVCPIFKSGDACNPDNYRPIAVLPCLSKIIERHIANSLTDDCISLLVTGTLRMTSTTDCRADDFNLMWVTGTLIMTSTIYCRTDDCISLMVTGTLRMTSTIDCRADDCISLLVTVTMRMTRTFYCRADDCISLLVTGTLRMTSTIDCRADDCISLLVRPEGNTENDDYY
ncbi:unnamed protein product [Mytilus edulis]|uniref:Uncharacterized protein n=1 Tax=Mytilus edulis TaxID=6550 RepID=A0A8S3TUZ3_MYTED|nr:unnamed protein product [Mytilus edulis]